MVVADRGGGGSANAFRGAGLERLVVFSGRAGRRGRRQARGGGAGGGFTFEHQLDKRLLARKSFAEYAAEELEPGWAVRLTSAANAPGPRFRLTLRQTQAAIGQALLLPQHAHRIQPQRAQHRESAGE
jgi:hypothetical protein